MWDIEFVVKFAVGVANDKSSLSLSKFPESPVYQFVNFRQIYYRTLTSDLHNLNPLLH